ncbi:MAG TPA: bifunctional phosphoribosylaminoimidazolecarboxamide formyltransferase/IMP cyclohydrolase, partial [Verrucomicrobiae bacterium]|nr:bifunctional phosphoribosylaminoimidazolecarboxamide formyltransferase/IMP cyclohydrolase [Verrucomicrobiae bacterium]
MSVFHKDGIVEFARSLIELGFEIISSGGTATHLAASGVKVTDVAEISGLKPILRHRVATLVPQIHGGLLATLDMLDELQELGYPWIDLVCVDLYPLKQEIAREGSTLESVIEKTDIGGPTLLRSGAKGRRIVVGSPQDRARVLAWLQAGRPSEKEFVGRLAAKAEGIVADYALASARYLSLGNIDGMVGTQVVEAKGENGPQSPAGLFRIDHDDPLAL